MINESFLSALNMRRRSSVQHAKPLSLAPVIFRLQYFPLHSLSNPDYMSVFAIRFCLYLSCGVYPFSCGPLSSSSPFIRALRIVVLGGAWVESRSSRHVYRTLGKSFTYSCL